MADTTFFFTNFPNEFQEKDLWRVFQRRGRVLDVFISRKLNARKQLFVFVRFSGVRDALALERQIDSIWIGTWKLQTNKPKCERQEKPEHTLQRQVHTQNVQSQKVHQRSFAQVVKGGNTGNNQKGAEDNLPHFRVNAETSFWLESCFVGKLLKATNGQPVKESFILGGFNFVRVRYIGEMYIVLSCEEEGLIERII